MRRARFIGGRILSSSEECREEDDIALGRFAAAALLAGLSVELGAVTPIGGVAFLAGRVALAAR
jgi:hypothetical protein